MERRTRAHESRMTGNRRVSLAVVWLTLVVAGCGVMPRIAWIPWLGGDSDDVSAGPRSGAVDFPREAVGERVEPKTVEPRRVEPQPPVPEPVVAAPQPVEAPEEPTGLEPEHPDERVSLLDPVLHRKWKGDFDAMIERRLMRVLVVDNKMLYFLDRGRQRGITYELFEAFEHAVNEKRGNESLRFDVVFIPVPHDQLLPRLVEGLGDVAAANLTITPERQQIVDFTEPAYRSVSEIIATGPSSDPIGKIEDLSGKEVFVRRSSSYWESLVAMNESFERRGIPGAVLVPAPEILEDGDLLEMLNVGLVRFVVVDDHKAKLWAKVFDDIHLHPDIVLRKGADIGMAFRKNSPKLETALNAFLRKHRKGTLLGNILLNRYLKSVKYVKSATTEAEMRKYREVMGYFRKYGDRYDLDPLLVAAQGYQESGLDQAVRSPVGAIGIMQIMPSLEKELGVGDITRIEPNIHGGVKYSRFIIDRYYAGESMDPVNQTLFAFASYNAGPARIRRLRREAEKRGFDPNVWFDNVEVVAAERIGRETVQYVSNIYKYFVAYTFVEEEHVARENAKRTILEEGGG